MLAEHCILRAGLSPGARPATDLLSAEQLAALMGEVRAFERWLASCQTTAPKGYIYTSLTPGEGDTASVPATPAALEALPPGTAYVDFDPLPLQQKAGRHVLEFETFDAALDEFFSKARLHARLQPLLGLPRCGLAA